ncbi:hypothetical protein NDU88_004101 [Pleurodeles waltl]|uniref:Uncharacterized protein n=1 Tax=Pleurodeles waltl TaxID=8319 RepID=A0AAV7SI00_PLEWA|nr:hypothetical protein NDU88_004101 [Pleurodeles waltl]
METDEGDIHCAPQHPGSQRQTINDDVQKKQKTGGPQDDLHPRARRQSLIEDARREKASTSSSAMEELQRFGAPVYDGEREGRTHFSLRITPREGKKGGLSRAFKVFEVCTGTRMMQLESKW